jgi:hypothetical protein
MPTLWEILKSSHAEKEKRKAEAEKLKHPLDTDVPFDLHIDGKITLTPMVFKFAESEIHLCNPTNPLIIDAVGRGQILGKKFFRVYLHDEKDPNDHSWLWIIQTSDGYNVRWFANLEEVFPASPAEWQFWTEDADGQIGRPDFLLKDGKLFTRAWDPSKERISPVNFGEAISLDRYDGTKNHALTHACMLYGRTVGGEENPFNEYTLITSVDGEEGSFIQIDVGVDVNPVDIQVVY